MSLRQLRTGSWLALLFALGALAAGAARAAADDDRQLVEQLAKRYWDAEVALDYGAIYDMLSASEQQSVARDEYVRSRRDVGPARYMAAEVGEIVLSGKVAWVRVKGDWALPRQLYAGARPGSTWQVWVKEQTWHPVPPDSRDQWPRLPPHLRPVADEAALAKRASEMWQAKIDQDWARVYAYMQPAYKARVSLEKFLQSKARFVYVTARVDWTEVRRDGPRARIVLSYRLNDPAASKMEPLHEELFEPWVKVDGEWYLDAPPPGRDPRAPAKEKAK